MSMPTFPEKGLDISKEQALTMILGSIAMEELALSHIMNAEGEKLQYVLGMYEKRNDICVAVKDLLEVNRSITDLLENATSMQILLKGKLKSVLEAMRLSQPPCHHGDGPCHECCECCEPGCSYEVAHQGHWDCGTCLLWRKACRGDERRSDECIGVLIPIGMHGACVVTYHFDLCAECEGPVSVSMQGVHHETSHRIITLEAHAKAPHHRVELSGSVALPKPCQTPVESLMFVLSSPERVMVHCAKVHIEPLAV